MPTLHTASYVGKTGTFDTDKYYDKETSTFDYDLFNSDFSNAGEEMHHFRKSL